MGDDGHTPGSVAGEVGGGREPIEHGAAKAAARRQARRRRAAVDWVDAGTAIRAQLARWLGGIPPTTVVVYLATGDEASVEELAALPDLGHRWAAPRLWPDERLTAHPLGGPCERHPLGFRQPAADAPRVPDHEIGVVLVPGLAFDRWGGRLGRGGGHYDRFLGRLGATPTTIGVTVDPLVADRPLPAAAHDVAVGLLATESGVRPVLDTASPAPRS